MRPGPEPQSILQGTAYFFFELGRLVGGNFVPLVNGKRYIHALSAEEIDDAGGDLLD